MFHTLRGRLVLSYAALVLFSVVLATGASLFLFGRDLDVRAHRDMALTAARLATTIEALAQAGDPDPGHGLGRLRLPPGPMGQVVLVDGEGKPVGATRGARPEFLEGRYPPPSELPPEGDLPRVAQVDLPSGLRVSYVSVPLPETLLGRAVTGPAWLTLVRPSGEVRGLWRGMVLPVALAGSVAMALATLLALALARSITRPIEDLTGATERMARGEYPVQVPVRRADEVGRLAAAFNTMSQEVAEAHRRQRDFVANVSHDLRTPLTTIRGFAGALLDGTARSEDQRRHAAVAIDAAAARMAALTDTLIDLARLEGHRVALELAPVGVAELLAGLAAAAAPDAELRGVRLEVADAGDLALRADAVWLARALGNVVDNAVRYSGTGGTVRLSAAAEGEQVALTVADDGPGIDPDDLPRVFERFYRGDKARLAGGSGLGLAIAREIVQDQEGSIQLDSAPGEGTRVTVRLPAA